MKQLLSVSSSVSATHQVEFSKGRFSTSRRRCCLLFYTSCCCAVGCLPAQVMKTYASLKSQDKKGMPFEGY